MTDFGPLFAPPPPPSGPRATVPSAVDGGYHTYVAWKYTQDGATVVAWVEGRALARFASGERRISARTLAADARDALKIKVNDHFTPWIADDLVARHPELLDVIERRKRRKAKVA